MMARLALLSLAIAVVALQFADAATVAERSAGSSVKFPPSTRLKMTMDWFIPVVPLLNSTFTFLQFNVPVWFNLPNYFDLQTISGIIGRISEEEDEPIDHNFIDELRSNHERRSVYKYIEELFNKVGYDGETCLQRAICEMAEAPLGHHGLFGQAAEILFSPKAPSVPENMAGYVNGSRRRRQALPDELHFLDGPVSDGYTEAYERGLKGQCWMNYSACPISIFKLINV